MAKQGWAAKLKTELAEAKAELEVLKADATNKDGVVSKNTSIAIGIIAGIAGLVLGGLFF